MSAKSLQSELFIRNLYDLCETFNIYLPLENDFTDETGVVIIADAKFDFTNNIATYKEQDRRKCIIIKT